MARNSGDFRRRLGRGLWPALCGLEGKRTGGRRATCSRSRPPGRRARRRGGLGNAPRSRGQDESRCLPSAGGRTPGCPSRRPPPRSPAPSRPANLDVDAAAARPVRSPAGRRRESLHRARRERRRHSHSSKGSARRRLEPRGSRRGSRSGFDRCTARDRASARGQTFSAVPSMDPAGRRSDPSPSRRTRNDDEQHCRVETRHPLPRKPPRSRRSCGDAAPRGKSPVHVCSAPARTSRRRQRPLALLLAAQWTDAAPRNDRAGLPRRGEHPAFLPRLPREEPPSAKTGRGGILRSDRGVRTRPAEKPRADAIWSGPLGADLRAAAQRRGCPRQRSPSVT